MKKPVILIVTRRGHVSECVMDHGLNIAERLRLGVLVVYVNTMPLLYDGGIRNRCFGEAVHKNVSDLNRRAESRGIAVYSVQESGKVSKVISRLCRILRNIEFIIADSGIKTDKVAAKASVPVFYVSENRLKRQSPDDKNAQPDRAPIHLCPLNRPGRQEERRLESSRD